jgi:hypothetical protein
MWDTELLNSITISSAAIVPIVVAFTQLVKMTDFVSSKYMPFISILIGILIAMLMANDTWNISQNILAGILFGLAASGLYSNLKASAVAFRQEKLNRLEKKDKENN